MARDLPKTRLRRAMATLGSFYGKAGTGGIEIAMLPEGTVNTLKSNMGGEESATETQEDSIRRLQGTFDAICGFGESTPTIAAILTENIEVGAEVYSTAGPMLIFPDETDDAAVTLASSGPANSVYSEGY